MRGHEAQQAYNLLKILSKSKFATVSFFKADWEETFSCVQVPPEQLFNNNDKSSFGIVRVDRLKAMEYLKNRFNFYTNEEREEALMEMAEEMKEEREI